MASMSMASRAALIAVTMALSGCSNLPLGFLGGGGPNVAANTQIGRENRQTAVGFEQKTEVGRDLIQKDVSAEKVDTVTINNEDIPPWVLLVALLGWLLPSPSEMGRGIYRLLRGER